MKVVLGMRGAVRGLASGIGVGAFGSNCWGVLDGDMGRGFGELN